MLKSVRVKDYMNTRPVTVEAGTDLLDAIDLILANKRSGITVVDGDHRPVGMLSELDCLRAILAASYHQEEAARHSIADVMSAPVETILESDDVIAVARSMLEHKRRRRPVVNEDGVMIGEITCRQLLRGVRGLETQDERDNGRIAARRA